MNRSLICIALLGLVSSISFADPIVGTYTNADGVLNGRWSESFLGGGESQVGNLIQAASWDGADLGTQWELVDVALVSDEEVSNKITGDLQVIQYYTVYEGGPLTFKGGPMMAMGDSEYDVTITSFTQSTIVTLFDGVPLTIAGAVSMQGVFADYAGYTLDYLAAVTHIDGTGAAAPVNYPAIIGANGGHWGEAIQVQLQIVPEPTTISVLSLGGLMVLIQRRRKA